MHASIKRTDPSVNYECNVKHTVDSQVQHVRAYITVHPFSQQNVVGANMATLTKRSPMSFTHVSLVQDSVLGVLPY